MERWLAIPSWPEYEVSDTGRVRRVGRSTMRLTLDKRGRPFVTLTARGKKQRKIVSRLVMAAFVGPSELLVRHLDDDPSHNALGNLAYGTQQDNMDDRAYGRSANAKLNEDEVQEVLRLHNEGRSMRSIAREYEVSHSSISRIINGEHYT